MPTDDDHQGPPATVLGAASTALGTIALLGQPAGCCLPLLGSLVLFAIAAVGLVVGMGAYRQANQNGLVGIELAIIGLTLGAMNVAFAVLWFAVSSVITLIGLFASFL